MDGRFDLYEDEGDNYSYEKGNYAIVPFKWDEERHTFTIGERQGNYSNSLKNSIFNIVFVDESNGFNINYSTLKKYVLYNGEKIDLKF